MSQFTDTSRLGISGQVVARALDTGRPALVGYLPVGYPTVAGSLELQPGDVVLVKASRGLSLDEVADQLVGGEE